MSTDKDQDELLQAFDELAQRPEFKDSKARELFLEYAEEGGKEAVNDLRNRLHAKTLSVDDVIKIHHVYFPDKRQITRREILAKATGYTIGMFALSDIAISTYHKIMSKFVARVADQQKHEVSAKKHVAVAMGESATAGLCLKMANKFRENYAIELRNSEDFSSTLPQLITESQPLLDALAEQIRDPAPVRGRE